MTRSQTRTIDFAASNLRGSPVPLYLAGTRILGSYPMGPRTGCALTVTMLSYCDEVHIGLNIDPAAISDVAAFMRDVRDAFDELAAHADRADRRWRAGSAPDVRPGRDAGVEPLLEERVAPRRVLAVARVVDDVEVQRRRFVGQVDQCGAARMRRRGVEQIDERNRREHPATAVGTRGNRRGFEPAGQQEQAIASRASSTTSFPSSSMITSPAATPRR